MNAAIPPPIEPAPASAAPEVSPDLKSIAQTLTIILAGQVDLSARVGRVENAFFQGPTPYAGADRRAPQASYTNETLRGVHDETFKQTGKLDSMLPAIQNTAARLESLAPSVANANLRTWLMITSMIAQTVALIAYAIVHGGHP